MRGGWIAGVLLAGILIAGSVAFVAWHLDRPPETTLPPAGASIEPNVEEIRALMRRRAEEAERAARPPLPPIPKGDLERFTQLRGKGARAFLGESDRLHPALTAPRGSPTRWGLEPPKAGAEDSVHTEPAR